MNDEQNVKEKETRHFHEKFSFINLNNLYSFHEENLKTKIWYFGSVKCR